VPIGFLPFISSYTALISSPNLSTSIVNGIATGPPNFLDAQNGYCSSIHVTGIILTNQAVLSGTYGYNTFPGVGSIYSLYYYNSQFVNFNAPATGAIKMYYQNRNQSISSSTVVITGFTASGTPSYPQAFSVTASTTTTLSVAYTAPQYTDILNPTTTAQIAAYQLFFSSVSTLYRYIGTTNFTTGSQTLTSVLPYGNSNSPAEVGSNVFAYTYTSLYPDTQTELFVQAKNTVNATYGQLASTIGTTSNLLPTTFASLTFNSVTYYAHGTIQRCSDNQVTTNVINTTGPLVSDTFITPIQTVKNRGSASASIMTLAPSLLTATGATSNGQTLTFGGYAQAPPSIPATLNGITLGGTGTKDTYSNSPVYNQGFYLESDNTVTIGSAVITGVGTSPNANTLTLLETQIDGTPGNVITSLTYTYYYDSLTTTPSIATLTDSITTSNMTKVSGINIAYNTLTVTINSSATNMGHYFYSNPLMRYTLALGSYTTTTTITTPPSTSPITGTLSFGPTTLVSPNITTNAIYVTSTILTAQANNPNTNSVDSNVTIAIIADGPSYSLVAAPSPTIPTSIPSIYPSGAVIGARCWSAGSGLAVNTITLNMALPNTPATMPAYSFTNTTPPTYGNTLNFASVLYSQAWYLTDSGTSVNSYYDATNELQVADGRFITPNSKLANNVTKIGYKAYSPYYGNTSVSPTSLIDYTSISASGYRYATFVWQVQPDSYGAYITFTFNNVKNIVQQVATPACAVTTNGNPLYILYRLEDASLIYPTLVSGSYQFDSAKVTSVWTNINAYDEQYINKSNYYDVLTANYPTSAYIRSGFSATSLSGGNFSIKGITISPSVYSGETVYLYLRVGLPMGDDVSFESISAQFSTS